MLDTIVYAYDPGLVTGWATWGPRYNIKAGGEVEDRHRFEAHFDSNMDVPGNVYEVVGEKYLITSATATKTRQYDALYINGYIDGKCARSEIPFTLQTPTQAKRFATDAKLKAVGWWTPTPGGHANDASRHLLTYLCASTNPALGGDVLLNRLVEALGL